MSKKFTRAIFIARLQPLHIEHERIINESFEHADLSHFDKIGILYISNEQPTSEDLANYHMFNSLFDYPFRANENDDELVKVCIANDKSDTPLTKYFCDTTTPAGYTVQLPFPNIVSMRRLLSFWHCDIVEFFMQRRPGKQSDDTSFKVLLKLPQVTRNKLKDLYFNWLLTIKEDGKLTLIREHLFKVLYEKWCFNCGAFVPIVVDKNEIELTTIENGFTKDIIVTTCQVCETRWELSPETRSKEYPGFITTTKPPKLPTVQDLEKLSL